MVRKDCLGCGRPSYTAADRGRWSCPHCGRDLSTEPLLSIYGDRMDQKGEVLPWKK